MISEHSLETEQNRLDNRQASTGSAEGVAQAQANALKRSAEYEHQLELVQNILRPALNSRHALDWEKFKRNTPYEQPEPTLPSYKEYPPEPKPEDPRYQPAPGPAGSPLNLDAAERRKRETYARYFHDYTAWAEQVKRIEAENERRYTESVAAIRQWHNQLRNHRLSQTAYNQSINLRKADYESLLVEAVEDYCRQILSSSGFPDIFKRVFDLQYVSTTKTLIVEHSLPLPSDLPRVKGVKFVQAKGEYVELRLSDAQLNRIYADVLHQICLRTLHELYDADIAQGLNAVVFNGWVEPVDPATGSPTRTCILSVRVEKAAFQALNPWDTDAKTCIKALTGSASTKLHALAPVIPVLKINH